MQRKDNFQIKNKYSYYPLFSKYKGYDMDNIMAVEMAFLKINGEGFKLNTLLKFITCFNFKHLRLNKRLFFVIGRHMRADYQEIYNFVENKFDDNITNEFNFNQLKYNFVINAKNVLGSLKKAFKLRDQSIVGKLIIASKLCFYKNNIDALENLSVVNNVRHAIMFSSIHPWEAMLVHYFKKRNVKTFSLQHGLTFKYNRSAPIDSLLYENFNVDIHICWSEYCKDQFIRANILPDKLLVGGYPRVVSNIVELNTPNDSCIVFLGRLICEESNFRLIEIIKEFIKKYPLQIDFKLHPSLSIDNYQVLNSIEGFKILPDSLSLTECIKAKVYGKAISVYSTAYYECYINNIHSLRFDDKTLEMAEEVTDDTFENIDQLIKIYNKAPDILEVRDRIKYLLGYGIDNYKEIID